MSTVRDEARKLVDQLPDGAGWDDLMYQIYVRQKIEAGRKAITAGRFVTQDEPLPPGASVDDLMALAGAIDDTSARQMTAAIDEAFERVDPSEW